MNTRQFLACAALLVLAGCGTAPPARLLSLPLPQPVVLDAAVRSLAPGVLVVRRVSIPEYLQANAVRFRAGNSLLSEWPGTAWADRLEVGLTDHLLMRLRLHLPGWTVCDRACPPHAKAKVLTVDLAPLDHVRATHELKAGMHWQLGQRGAEGRAHTKAVVMPVATDSPEGQAEALGQVLDLLAQDVAQYITHKPAVQP